MKKRNLLAKKSLALTMAAALLIFPAAGCSASQPQGTAPAVQTGGNAASYEKSELRLEGVINARQFGGYTAKSGRKVRKLFYRSGELAFATDSDLRILKKKHITKVFDLRYPDDYVYCPDARFDGCTFLSLPFTESSSSHQQSAISRYQETAAYPTPEERLSYMASRGKVLGENYFCRKVTSAYSNRQLKKYFRYLLKQKDGEAVLIHCTYGKDRTGYVCAMTLLLLGVDEKTVLDDFALSNEGFSRALGSSTVVVKRSSMKKALKLIRKKYGSYKNYFRKGVGLSDKNIRQLKIKYTRKPSA